MLSGGYTVHNCLWATSFTGALSKPDALKCQPWCATHFLLGHLDLAVDLELLEDREQRVGAPWGGMWVGRRVRAKGL